MKSILPVTAFKRLNRTRAEHRACLHVFAKTRVRLGTSVTQDLLVRALTGAYADEPYSFSDLERKGMVSTVKLGRGLQHDDVKRWSNPLWGSVYNQLLNFRGRVFGCLAKVNIHGRGASKSGVSTFENSDCFRCIFWFQDVLLDVSPRAPEFLRII